MPELDRTQTNAIFGELIDANGLDSFVVPPADLRVVPMDFKRVGLNLFEGERLHDVLREVRSGVIGFLGSIGAELENSPLSRNLMVDAMERQLSNDESIAEAFGGLVAIEGPGWFGIEKPGKTSGLGNGLIDHTERMFGTLQGIGYGQYQEVTPEALRLCQEEHIQPEVAIRAGGFIGLVDAVVCRGAADGLGEVDERYDRVLVPIDVAAFQWSRVYPLE
jgi:hypothetical protein